VKDTPSKPRTISAKRQAILAMAFAQLRKSRAMIDPSILSKIRRIVSGSPDIMKKLGVTDLPKAEQDMPLSQKQPALETKAKVSRPKPKKVAEKQGNEAVDQAKNMEIIAKLMQLNPDGREGIKAVIKKAGK
jgi:hypothetical protein